MNLSAHQFKQVYEDLGYDLTKLGCIMLNTKPIHIGHLIDDADLYYTKNPDRFWIKGRVAEDKPHVTLLYGLIRSGRELRKHVDRVLDIAGDTKPEYWPRTVEIKDIGYFDSPYEDDPYYCIVAHLQITSQLRQAHDRLSFLPHIVTFPGYKAHITLAYIKKDPELRNKIIGKLTEELGHKTIKTLDVDYGGNK